MKRFYQPKRLYIYIYIYIRKDTENSAILDQLVSVVNKPNNNISFIIHTTGEMAQIFGKTSC